MHSIQQLMAADSAPSLRRDLSDHGEPSAELGEGSEFNQMRFEEVE